MVESGRTALLRFHNGDLVGNLMNAIGAWLGGIPEVSEGVQACQCTWPTPAIRVRPDYLTLGVLVLYTQGAIADWVDLIISDLHLESLTEQRIAALERELGAPFAELEVARANHDQAHAEILGSSRFTIIRLSSIGARHIEC